MGRTLRSPGHIALMTVLKQARQDAGLTQTELAERLKRPQSFVAKYENGERRIEVLELIEITDALAADPCRIIGVVRSAGGRTN